MSIEENKEFIKFMEEQKKLNEEKFTGKILFEFNYLTGGITAIYQDIPRKRL